MKILIATPILYDRKSPFNHIFKDILEGLISDGNEITRIVACEKYCDKEYTFGIESENIHYIEVKRKECNKGDIFNRYITDNITCIKMAWIMLRIKGIDILFEDVSYSSFWVVVAAKIKSIKTILMIQDVWPDNSVQSGILNNESLLYKYFEIWQRYVYKKSERLICISEDIKAFIIQKGVDKEKISVIYNWGYSDEKVDISWDENKFVEKYKLNKNEFYAVYAGNIGKMQNVKMVVNAAQKLEDDQNIHFLIIGDGVKRNEIVESIKKKNMKNITILPMQPSDLATSIYSMAGVNIIPLVKGGIKTALPSKIGVCLSCGQTILLCLEKHSKIANLIEQSNSGVVIEPDDVNSLAQTITDIANGTVNIKNQDVWNCFSENFTRKANVDKIKNIVRKIYDV